MTDMEVWGINHRTARTAGLLYLVVVLTGIFNLLYVPSQLFVAGDAAATSHNIQASLPLFKLSILAGVLCYTAFLFLPLVLYRLLAPFGRTAATLMVALALVSVPLSLANLVHRHEVLTLLGGAEYLSAFTPAELHARVELALESYRSGIRVSEVFWGLWLFPFGLLAYRSGAIPRLLGVLLMAGCFGYLIHNIAGLFHPQFESSKLASIISLPAGLGEIGTCLWLLIRGAGKRAA
ncbi:MAG: DUF4386 domain-containing protein [Steroidobacteraceae bacterium]